MAGRTLFMVVAGTSIGLSLALAIAPVSTQAQMPVRHEALVGDLARRVDDTLTARHRRGFRGYVLVEHDGALVLSAGYGWADTARKSALTSSTVLPTGSLTKQFTAIAVVDLWRRGLLAFEDTLSRHLRGYGPVADQITVHQLLTHTSGMAEYCGADFDRATRREFLTRCLGRPLRSAPGAVYAYSNPGYSVLAALVEVISRQTIQAYLAERLFTPLGMRQTGYAIPNLDPDSVGVIYTDGKPAEHFGVTLRRAGGELWNVLGNGGISSSPRDMLTWLHALAAGPVITDEMRSVTLRPYAPHPSGNVSYGYGWNVRFDDAGVLQQVSHSGADGTFAAVAVWRPADRTLLYLVGLDNEDLAFDVTRAVLRTINQAVSGSRGR